MQVPSPVRGIRRRVAMKRLALLLAAVWLLVAPIPVLAFTAGR
jgi:ABC-type transport system involved in cytochrome c biogenesis ATPase subunit